MDSSPDDPVVEVRDSLPRYSLLVLACLIGAVAMVLTGGPILVPALLGGFGLWALSRVMYRPPRLQITEEGVIDRTFWYSPGFIPWEEIIDIRPARWWRVDIDVRDRAAFLERLSRVKKLRRYRWRLYGLGPAAVNPLLLGIPRGRLVEALQAGLDEYTLAEARSQARVGDCGEGEAPRLEP